MTQEITENNLAKYFAQRNGGDGVDAFNALFSKRVDPYLNHPAYVASFTMGNPYVLVADFEDEPGNPLTRTCGICTFVAETPTLNAFFYTNDSVAGETITVSFTITMTRG